MVWKIRRSLGMAIHRANASLTLDRLPLMGGRASAAAGRRARARTAYYGSSGPADSSYAYSRSRASHSAGAGR